MRLELEVPGEKDGSAALTGSPSFRAPARGPVSLGVCSRGPEEDKPKRDKKPPKVQLTFEPYAVKNLCITF